VRIGYLPVVQTFIALKDSDLNLACFFVEIFPVVNELKKSFVVMGLRESVKYLQLCKYDAG